MNNKTSVVYDINMTVLNDDNFLSPYSPTDEPIITGDVAEFLENGAAKFNPKQKLQLNIYSNCIDGQEQSVYKSAIHNYFALKLAATQIDLKRNLIVSVIFTVIGLLGLVAMVLLDRFFGNAIWTEVVDIFAWVFVWEAVDQFFIERLKLLRDCKKYKAFVNAPVNYQPLNK